MVYDQILLLTSQHYLTRQIKCKSQYSFAQYQYFYFVLDKIIFFNRAILTFTVLLHVFIQPVETTSPSQFIDDIKGYRRACKSIGWEPKQGSLNNCFVIILNVEVSLNKIKLFFLYFNGNILLYFQIAPHTMSLLFMQI